MPDNRTPSTLEELLKEIEADGPPIPSALKNRPIVRQKHDRAAIRHTPKRRSLGEMDGERNG